MNIRQISKLNVILFIAVIAVESLFLVSGIPVFAWIALALSVWLFLNLYSSGISYMLDYIERRNRKDILRQQQEILTDRALTS